MSEILVPDEFIPFLAAYTICITLSLMNACAQNDSRLILDSVKKQTEGTYSSPLKQIFEETLRP